MANDANLTAADPVAKPERRTLRVFFALWPDAAAARALDACGAKLQGQCGGRRMRRDTLHLTLSFVGEVAPAHVAALRALAARISVPAFDFPLDECGSWQGHRIVWLAPAQPVAALDALACALDAGLRAASFTPDARVFNPHVTLLRNARAAPVPLREAVLQWAARDYCLVASERTPTGAHYRVLGRWPLAGREDGAGEKGDKGDKGV